MGKAVREYRLLYGIQQEVNLLGIPAYIVLIICVLSFATSNITLVTPGVTSVYLLDSRNYSV